MKYIDADKLKAKIKRRHDYENEMYHKKKPDGRPNDGWAESLAIMGVLEELLAFIDSLQQEQPEVDLEKELDTYYDSPLWDGEPVSWMTYTRIARHFAEWGAEHLKR